MASCAPVIAPVTRRTNRRLFARRKTSVTADDDAFEMLARSAPASPASPSFPCLPPTQQPPKRGVSFNTSIFSSQNEPGVANDDAASPWMLPVLPGSIAPGSTRSVQSSRVPTPFVSATGARTPRRPLVLNNGTSGSPAGRARPVVSAAATLACLPTGSVGEEGIDQEKGPLLSRRTRIEVSHGVSSWQQGRSAAVHKLTAAWLTASTCPCLSLSVRRRHCVARGVNCRI